MLYFGLGFRIEGVGFRAQGDSCIWLVHLLIMIRDMIVEQGM